jgi:hypothetical protein
VIKSSTKAQYAILVGVVLFLTILAVLLALMGDFFKTTDDTNWKAACKASVQGHIYQKTPIVCPLQYKNLTEEKNIEEELVRMMKTCWEIYGEGDLDLFNPLARKYCAICYVVDVGDQEVDLEEYLQTRRIPRTKTYYSDYFKNAITYSDFNTLRNRIGILYTEEVTNPLEDPSFSHALRVVPYNPDTLINLGCDVVDVQQH